VQSPHPKKTALVTGVTGQVGAYRPGLLVDNRPAIDSQEGGDVDLFQHPGRPDLRDSPAHGLTAVTPHYLKE